MFFAYVTRIPQISQIIQSLRIAFKGTKIFTNQTQIVDL